LEQEAPLLKRFKDLNVLHVKRHISSGKISQVELEENLQILLFQSQFVTLSKGEVVMQ